MNRRFFTSLAAAGLVACTIVTAPAQAASAAAEHTIIETQSSMSRAELEACTLVNALRAERGLSPLEIDASVSAGARVKSRDMKASGYFSHTSPGYGTPFQMMKTLGVSYRSAGENIAQGYRNAQTVVEAWMRSQSHRELLLSSRYTAMGIGHADGYWTLWLIG